MGGSDDEGDNNYEAIRQVQNRKDKKAGGWQAIGLDHAIFKGIEKKGYRQPTPIQRKTIPVLIDGKDVVAMSRTGSGKTAAFVIPMLQRLKKRETKGTRALLISPTRELALQTFKVVKELGRYTGLHCACLVGGDSMDDQFASLHESPDILIATPGRLLHIVVEMNLRLSSVQYIVFDEADRLFEMGFMEQLTDILKRLPEDRQTLLFSATLPKMLVDFAKAGLSDPLLIRLDVDEKVSELLSMSFVLCRPADRIAATVALARQAVAEEKLTVLFCATMKHVEYIVAILNRAGCECAFIYSQLDATARKQNIAKFREKKVFLLVVTDVAARGVDIPLLDTVINVHFPPKPKLFVHRAGRVARAGRTGTAISLVAADEMPYLADLFLFLGKPMNFAKDGDTHDPKNALIGKLPDRLVDIETEFLINIHDNNSEMFDLQHKSEQAMGKYMRTRPPPSAESARRVKSELRAASANASFHPFLRDSGDKQEASILNALANYRANATIFEIHSSSKDKQAGVMKNMRRLHGDRIRTKKEESEQKAVEKVETEAAKEAVTKAEQADEELLAQTFTELIGKSGKKLSRKEQLEEEKKLHFISYTAADANSERMLGVDFTRAAEGAHVDMTADDDKGLYKAGNQKKWDRKLKRFVGESGDDPKKKKIRTEDGTWIPATYKTGRYEEWVQRQRVGYGDGGGGDGGDRDDDDGGDEDDDGGEAVARRAPHFQKRHRWAKNKGDNNAPDELRRSDQILKTRKKKEKVQSFQQQRRTENLKRKMAKGGKGGGIGKKGAAVKPRGPKGAKGSGGGMGKFGSRAAGAIGKGFKKPTGGGRGGKRR